MKSALNSRPLAVYSAGEDACVWGLIGLLGFILSPSIEPPIASSANVGHCKRHLNTQGGLNKQIEPQRGSDQGNTTSNLHGLSA
ncbi:hypothetical protein ASPCADRAFT_206065 [Aspergillus carbonarius ITEM 5010]|uniref:Uncharacterized protein n=1 Tax=Aspergillus carbonarius (strain ITEM 5010) TaxID=602072 RepID=A0A1R3RRZ5_ASPC5|nr:hypothetical protein ASPCADRAFT_206065 [Aspergillus carbonarius ITEM 5010]